MFNTSKTEYQTSCALFHRDSQSVVLAGKRVALSRRACSLLLTLPSNVQLRTIATAYPQVANRIARAWGQPAEFQQLVDDLLFVRHDDETQLSHTALAELLSLREYRHTVKVDLKAA